MRPLHLQMQGFAAFREPTSIDLEEVDLFALVGRTGSGKSTIVDAICFVLYGSVPRYEDRRAVSPVISAGALEAKVSLTFDVEGTQYTVARVVRRDTKGGATTKEARLERDDGQVLAGMARELDPAVEQLLGLSFDHFTRSVVLPQGEFQRFLHDKPRDRQGLLVDLLGLDVYGRMMQRANQLGAEHETDIARIEERLGELSDCTPEERDAWRESVKTYGEFRQELRHARPELVRLNADAETARAEADAARLLVELLLKVKVPPAVRKLAEDQGHAQRSRQDTQRSVKRAVAETEKHEKVLEALPERDPLVQARDAHRLLGETRDRLEKARSALKKKQLEEKQAARTVEAAQGQLAAARTTLEELRLDHAAHEAAQGLKAGEPCPVCQQVVAEVPRRRAPAGLATATRAVEKCESQITTATKTHTNVVVKASAEQRTVTDLQEREQDCVTRVAQHPDAAKVEGVLAKISTATEALSAARTQEKSVREAETKSEKKLEALEVELRKTERHFRDQRDQLVAEGAEVPSEREADLLERWTELSDWALKQAPASKKMATEADKRMAKCRTAYESGLASLRTSAKELELSPPQDAGLEDLAELAIEGEKEAKDAVKEIESGIKERKALEKKQKGLGAEAAVAKQLGQLLRADGFERWLLAEALETLVDGASARLNDLSGGQYSFAFDESSRDFLIVDHGNADERRSVRTLSGGETFQAALALALSLSDHLKDLAAEGAARLDAIFLDEGFGSLDPETLDTVAATIENLGAGDRMVGVITHVTELAERLPVQYRVEKGARTSTIQKVLQ